MLQRRRRNAFIAVEKTLMGGGEGAVVLQTSLTKNAQKSNEILKGRALVVANKAFQKRLSVFHRSNGRGNPLYQRFHSHFLDLGREIFLVKGKGIQVLYTKGQGEGG